MAREFRYPDLFFTESFRTCSILFIASLVIAVGRDLDAQWDTTVKPNYEQAARYSSAFLGQRTYSTSVSPQWIGKTDRFWYRYQTADGAQFFLVNAAERTKTLLFDHDRVAAALSVALRQPVEANALPLGRAKVSDDGKTLSFVAEKKSFELDLSTLALTDKGAAPEPQRGGRNFGARTRSGRGRAGRRAPPRSHRAFAPDNTAYVFAQGYNLYYVEASDDQKAAIAAIDKRMKEEAERKKNEAESGDAKQGETEKKDDTDKKVDNDEKDDGDKKDDGDEKVDEHDENQTEKQKDQDDDNDTDEQDRNDEQNGGRRRRRRPFAETDERRVWANDVNESAAVQLTDDGEEDYGFSFGGFRRGRNQVGEEDASQRKSRPNVGWSEDSTAFHATRHDSRGVAELFLVNSLGKPRPTLEQYKYAMPGEEHIRRAELYCFDRQAAKLERVATKWIDEGYQNMHFGKTGDELRFVRRDRLLRNVELVAMNTRTHEVEVLLEDGFQAANIATQRVRYIKDGAQFIWWSERSGWGHYYLYDRDGTFVNAITSGAYRASRIVDIDEDKGLLYFYGNGREPNENVYYQHLYRVFFDGTGLALLDPGDANHRSSLSPTHKYLVDNCSRVDLAPCSSLRDTDGNEIMKLEETDLSKLEVVGWRMPETFVVKAADGVTDLYGNMWKPFDFDPKKKYPIIANVYPGPQTEGVTHTFSSHSARQQLAQIGFIVIQVGHRGGTPGRSKAYHSYGYYNLRDYGLEDKKAAIEQLAVRFPWIDINRVGIYGHSGGGFMTAAALMRPPYNDFFKVGVASSGNHDNNIYNNTWAERYHGLKEVENKDEQKDRQRSNRRRRRDAELRRDIVDSTLDDGDVAAETEGDREVAAWSDEELREQERDRLFDGDPQQQRRRRGRAGRGRGEQGDSEADSNKKHFEIEVPTNTELAANLKGHLLLVHGEIDNNVHPANTMRLVDALIKANKRFDMLIIPGARHGYGVANGYFQHRMWEYFAEYLLGDRRDGADILEER